MLSETTLSVLTQEELIKIVLKQADFIKNQTDFTKELEKKISALENELKKYKNSNTPPSANKHLKPNTKGKQTKSNNKRGAPKNHKGTTRKQEIDRKEVIDTDTCSKCGSKNIKDKQVFKRVTEEIPEPIIPETVENEIHKKECLDCGNIFIPNHNRVPLKGKFGINVMLLVIFIKFLLRGVLRKAAEFLRVGFALTLTPAAINSIIQRVAEAGETEYEMLKQRIRNSDKVYVDETSFSVLGINQWVWVFRTSTDILLVIRPCRGSPVLKEILGEDYKGKIICDCWRAYDFLGILQRCWSHLLRKSKENRETLTGRHLHEKLKSMFEEIKRFNNSNPMKKEREKKYEIMTEKLQSTIRYYAKYEELKDVITYIGNNIENWFTCVKYEGIEPTNNFAEQAIRETVIVRKIIGAFRSEKGKENYEILASLIASWQLNKLDIKEKLKAMLIKNLCFC